MVQNILYIHHTSKISGAEMSLFNLLINLAKDQFKSIVICPSLGPYVDKLKQHGIRVKIFRIRRLKRSLNPLFYILSLFSLISFTIKLIGFIKRERISLVHANSFIAGIYGSPGARLTNIPIIWHIRDIIRPRWVSRFLTFVAGKLASQIIVVSNATGAEFTQRGKKLDKTVTIYNGIDLDEFNPNISGIKIKKEFGLNCRTPIIGILGQLAPGKGHKVFIKAARKILKYFPTAKFLIVGDIVYHHEKRYRRKLKEMVANLSLTNNIVFTGFRNDVPEIMSSLDVLVHTSIMPDSLPRVLLEAMALGKPIVATNVGGVPEIIEDGKTGILVSPDNADAVAEAVVTLLQDKERAKQMGLAGRQRVEQNFSIEKHIERVQGLYTELLIE